MYTKKLFWLLLMLGSATVLAQVPSFESVKSESEPALNTNLNAPFWSSARVIYAELDANGKPVPEYRTEVRSRWTKDNLYFLFICPYKHLYLKPAPNTEKETYELWNWNVAEVFIGSDFRDIKRYKEFEVSPQNEWVDLDINLNSPHHENGWVWNSGFEHKARIDKASQKWYVAMRIPFAAIGAAPPTIGSVFRINLYRTEGPPQQTKEVMWHSTMSQTFHVPERFGELKLTAK